MSEFIELHQLSPEVRHALRQYGDDHYYDEWLRSFIEPQWFAWLIELLKVEPDTEELFPKGKWATVQHMQELLTRAAEEEITTRQVGGKEEQMGWCGGTEVFDQIAAIVLSDKPLDKKATLKAVINSLENSDWDCQSDSAYWEHPLVQEVMREMHPRWFEDES